MTLKEFKTLVSVNKMNEQGISKEDICQQLEITDAKYWEYVNLGSYFKKGA